MCLHRLEGRKMSKPHCHPSFLFVSFCLSKRRLFSPSSSLLFSSFFSSSSASSMFHELLQSVCHCPDHPPLPPFAPALPSLPPSIHPLSEIKRKLRPSGTDKTHTKAGQEMLHSSSSSSHHQCQVVLRRTL